MYTVNEQIAKLGRFSYQKKSSTNIIIYSGRVPNEFLLFSLWRYIFYCCCYFWYIGLQGFVDRLCCHFLTCRVKCMVFRFLFWVLLIFFMLFYMVVCVYRLIFVNYRLYVTRGKSFQYGVLWEGVREVNKEMLQVDDLQSLFAEEVFCLSFQLGIFARPRMSFIG